MTRHLRPLLGGIAIGVMVGGNAFADDRPLTLFDSVALLPDESNYLDLAAGAYAYPEASRGTTAAARGELRFGDKFLYMGPAVGVLGNAHGGIIGYAGVYTDIKIGPFVVTPLTSVAADHRGDSADTNLGGVFEFRSELTASYQFANNMRVGAMIAHVSNAGINRHNPGENEVMVSYGIPFGW